MKHTLKFILTVAAISAIVTNSAFADPASCITPKFSDVGWTDIQATTGLTTEILTALGYTPKIDVLSVPVTFSSLKSKNIDAYLGNWMPTQEADRKPYVDSIEIIGPNLTGAKYTLAVPSNLYAQGLKSFADIAKFKNQLNGKLYGIEPGNDGNRLILDMIAKNQFDLGGFQLVESSEQAMLAQVDKSVQKNEGIVFLGWAPHPMNTKYKIDYLSGGDDVFGPDFGGANVYTNLRNGYTKDCPNAAKLIHNLKFSLNTENVVMGYILDDKMTAEKAADKWLKDNQKDWSSWLDGVTTFDGQPAVPAVKKYLGLS